MDLFVDSLTLLASHCLCLKHQHHLVRFCVFNCKQFFLLSQALLVVSLMYNFLSHFKIINVCITGL